VVYTFALFEQPITPAFVQSLLDSRPAPYAKREDLYHRWCARCHGVGAISGGAVQDLRRSAPDVRQSFTEIVRKGMPGVGMPSFAGILSDEEIREIETYVGERRSAAP
jgi:mono/diheme cytochrome c family protein